MLGVATATGWRRDCHGKSQGTHSHRPMITYHHHVVVSLSRFPASLSQRLLLEKKQEAHLLQRERARVV